MGSIVNSTETINGLKFDSDVASRFERGKTLYGQAMSLNEGEGFRIDEPEYWSSLDLGRTNWSIGKDEKGIYAAIADVWDFSGDGNIPGSILDNIGEPINMYSRIYLNENDFYPDIFQE